MKIRIQEELTDIQSYPIMVKEGEPWTLKAAVVQALISTFPNDNATGDEKYKRAKLAHRIQSHTEPEIDMTAEEVALTKKMAGHVFTTVALWAVWDKLEK